MAATPTAPPPIPHVIEPCGCEASDIAKRLLVLALDRIGLVDVVLGDEIAAYLEGLERGRSEASR